MQVPLLRLRWPGPPGGTYSILAAQPPSGCCTGCEGAGDHSRQVGNLIEIDVAIGHWSASAVRGNDPLSASAGPLPAAAMIVLLAAALGRAVGIGRDLAVAERTCRRLGPAPTGLVIVKDDHPDAYTLPGVTGRVVISTAMLRALPADERRVLLAHEQSHLRHRHHAFTQLADLAAAANPLLRRPARGATGRR